MPNEGDAPRGAVADWIAKNLWAILALIGGIAQGYNVGTSAMAAQAKRLDVIETDRAAEKAENDTFHHCIVRTVDWLKSKATNPPPCELE